MFKKCKHELITSKIKIKFKCMDYKTWREWLKWLDNQFDRSIILLVDNCPAHTDVNDFGLKNISVYLPANTVSVLQPLDAAIINLFKVKYKKLLGADFIKAFDSNKKTKHLVDLDKDFEYIYDAWYNVSQRTFVNCWKKTGILPDNSFNGYYENQDEVKELNLV